MVSGDAAALTALLAQLNDDGVKSSMLEVSHAFHSPRLDPMLDALERRARDVRYAAPANSPSVEPDRRTISGLELSRMQSTGAVTRANRCNSPRV